MSAPGPDGILVFDVGVLARQLAAVEAERDEAISRNKCWRAHVWRLIREREAWYDWEHQMLAECWDAHQQFLAAQQYIGQQADCERPEGVAP